jgi:Mrp family chromosome partitioning ATPase
VASNLGIVLAEAGYRTLLVDCNRKNPALLSSFGLDGDGKGRGKKKDKADEAEQPAEIGRIYNTEYPELDLLPYSSLPAQVSGIVRPSDLTGLLQKYEGDYQLFICDTPALGEASDALGLVQHFPNILFVVDGRQAKVMQDKEKLETLTVGDAALEGLVVNWMQKRN